MSFVMYSTTWCGYCKRLKSQLADLGISFEEINIEEVPGTAQIVEKVNGGNQTVPPIPGGIPPSPPPPPPREPWVAITSSILRSIHAASDDAETI